MLHPKASYRVSYIHIKFRHSELKNVELGRSSELNIHKLMVKEGWKLPSKEKGELSQGLASVIERHTEEY